MRTLILAAAAALAWSGLAAGVRADDGPPRATKVVVKDMTCAGCAKTLAKALTAVGGVERVEADVTGKTVTVTPKAGAGPSPKALWEAVEKAGYTPARLDGPAGAFEKKPAA